MKSINLRSLDGAYAIARLDPAAAIPAWADGPGFVSIGRTADELSVVCREDRVADGVRKDGGWRVFKFEGPFAFSETGVLLSVIAPLSEAGIGIFAVSTFDTDYLLLKADDAEKAATLLRLAGHLVS